MKSVKFFTIVLTTSALFFACSFNSETETVTTKEEKVIKVKSMQVDTKDVPIYSTYYGEVKFNQSVTVVAEMNGEAKSLRVKAGQRIKAGQTLLSYPRKDDNIEIENKQIGQAQITLAELKSNYQRHKNLFEKGAVNRVSVEELETQIKVMENSIEQLRLGVEKIHSIKSPFSGILTEVHIEKGQQLAFGMPLFTIAKSNKTEVEFYVLPKDFASVTVGKPIELIDGQNIISGQISEKAAQVDPMRKAIKVAATFDRSAQQLLVGSTVELRLLKETLKEALVIPEETLTQQGKSHFVYTVKAGKAIKQHIQIAQRTGLEIVVKEGLKKGDEVITAGMNKLKNNMAIEVVR
ncbi:MAG: efflux RND transporter periplasmic adaptor subunit [Bacteroidota bacterium]